MSAEPANRPEPEIQYHWFTEDRVVAWSPHLELVVDDPLAPPRPSPLMFLAFAGLALPPAPDPVLGELLACPPPVRPALKLCA